MTSGNPLKKLLRASLAKRTNKKLFSSLLEQLLARDQIPDSQLAETLFNITPYHDSTTSSKRNAGERLQLEYAVEFALSSTENLARFSSFLSQSDHTCQLKYISFFRSQAKQINSRPLAPQFHEKLSQVTAHLISELASVSGPVPESTKRLWTSVVFMWGIFIDLDPRIAENAKLKEVFLKMTHTASASKDEHIKSYITRKIIVGTDIEPHLHLQDHNFTRAEALATGKPSRWLALNLNAKKFSSYLTLKKFVWLNGQFRSWRMSTKTSRAFVSFFGLQDLGNQDLAAELIRCYLNGFVIAIKSKEKPYVVLNWRNFILTQLASDLKNLVFRSSRVEENWYRSILTAVASCDDPVLSESKVGGAKAPHNLKKDFLRTCVYQGILPSHEFITTFSAESENLTPTLMSQESSELYSTARLTAEFRSRLENVNPELTSLLESKLFEYFQSLLATDFRLSSTKQQTLAQLMDTLVRSLIRDKDNVKLSWIALLVSNIPAMANILFYQNDKGPWNFLNQLISYIDGETFYLDEDDGNFQETYACFGIILTGVIAVADFFGIDFSSITIKNSYTIDFISQFYFRSCDVLTNTYTGTDEQETQIVTNYDQLFKEWANALFDVNNDGLSDELLKSINVKQIYKFIFFLFREAFSARVMGLLNETSLRNGIDYLSQNFLAPCSIELIRWILSKIGPLNKDNDVMVDILSRIIEALAGDAASADSGQNYTSRMILNVIGPHLLNKLNSFTGKANSEIIAKLSKLILQDTDPEYCQWSNHPDALSRVSRSMSDSLTSEITNFSREDQSGSLKLIGDSWLRIDQKWGTSSANEVCSIMLQETEHVLNALSPQTLEESKLVLDFFVFMVACSSCRESDDISSHLTNLEAEKALGPMSRDVESKFQVTINDHYSAIFNESAGSNSQNSPVDEAKPRSREDLMDDFEMGDLFDDMPGNFFDESMGSFHKSETPVPARGSMDISSTYDELWRRMSPLRGVSHCMCNPEHAVESQLKHVLRDRLIGELEKWKSSLV